MLNRRLSGGAAARQVEPRRTPWLVLLAVAIAGVGAVELLVVPGERVGPAVTPQARAAVHSGAARNYDEAVAQLDLAIRGASERAAAQAGDWLPQEVLARAWFARARLTGSFEDYAAAEAALKAAFALAPERAGPHLAQAIFDFSMHRLAAAERQIGAIEAYAVPPDDGEQADLDAMRGDIAFYRGDAQGALDLYDRADASWPGAASFRRAIHAARTGDVEKAEAYFDETERTTRQPKPQLLGNLELQRGILDLERGRWDEALAHFNAADRIFPGHWLIEEHIAEVTALKGDLGGAEARYRDIVRRTGHPEFMDALAGIARQRGDAEAAAAWTARAAQIWQRRLRQFPEAAYGHALDHCIDAGRWQCALTLAQRNHAARPYGEAKIMLAQALLHNGRADEAKAMIDAVLASPWRTAQLHVVAAEIHARAGDNRAAAAQLQLARRIDPRAAAEAAAELRLPSTSA